MTSTEPTSERRGSVLDMLRELLAARRDEEVLAIVKKLVARNNELELLLAKMRESKNRGERISREQLDLFLDKLKSESDEALAAANDKLAQQAEQNGGRPERTKPAKQPAVRRPPPPGLRRVENVLSVPEQERACPQCGGERTCVCHEKTEVIELVPAEVIVRVDCREVLACPACDGEMTRAPMGDKVIEGGAYGARLVGQLVVEKYWDGLPLHRQADQLERLGLSMPSSSMADQITWATELLRPIWVYLMGLVVTSTVMHLDATSLPVRDKSTPKGITLGALWGYVGDECYAVYLYTSTGKKNGQRQGEVGPEEFLARRTGYTVADASNLFDKSFARADLIEVGCNMHARRYFKKALDAGDARAAVPIAAFRALYDVEDSVREASAEQRLDARTRRSRPVYDELVRWCDTYLPIEPPSSLLAKALGYMRNHRVALTRFLDDGIVPIDNGIVERLHRRPAITRRAFLFAGSHEAAERAAIAYSITASCELADVNPAEYLADILPRLARGIVVARDVPNMVPATWKRLREQAARDGPAVDGGQPTPC